MTYMLKLLYRVFTGALPSYINALISGLPFNTTYKIVGRPYVIKVGWFRRSILRRKGGTIQIGNNFVCNNAIDSNSIGLIQPCVFNIATNGSLIKIGNNVGISGSTINATTSITIGDNVLIGSGCIITDTDSHPLYWQDRINNNNDKTKQSPIIIEDNVFIGARSIILKGVTIGKGAVVGAGSVVSRDVPAHTVVCGNPIKNIKKMKNEEV